ncbi:MAG: hypothetical protein AAGD25_31465, partial [Cyanobacteria bacterium P01_F01_bin.150]
ASSVNAGVGDTVEEGVIMVKVQITTTLSLLPFLALLLSPQRVFELLILRHLKCMVLSCPPGTR